MAQRNIAGTGRYAGEDVGEGLLGVLSDVPRQVDWMLLHRRAGPALEVKIRFGCCL